VAGIQNFLYLYTHINILASPSGCTAMKVKGLKYIICIALAMMSAAVAMAQAVVKFPHKIYDFGEVMGNVDSVTCSFDIVNAGKSPLIIEGVYVKCGCTQASHSKKAIKPGGKGYVYVTFYPKGREGTYLKSIYVYTNTSPRKNILRIKAFVKPTLEEGNK
jgi:hypothetical protein